ncbi:MAG: hypothetical protein AAFX03_02605 [Pseudomonadota bacterium]
MRRALVFTAALCLAACGQTAEPVSDAAVPAEPAGPEVGSLDWAIAGDWRSDLERARDAWRSPKATLEFFGLEPGHTVVEVWPGGGWYTNILAPYLKEGGGQFIAAGFDPEGSEFAQNAMARFNETYVGDPETYGDIEVTVFSSDSDGMAPAGTADVVLTFRNVHNWMAGGYQAKAFADAYAALKPGGILGVVEHRLPSTEVQDPVAASGYVHEDYVKAQAEAAGFEFVDSSEINANPVDTADHPFGVWTLPPVSRTADQDGETPEGFDPDAFRAIGESDRMTLKFRKPAES